MGHDRRRGPYLRGRERRRCRYNPLPRVAVLPILSGDPLFAPAMGCAWRRSVPRPRQLRSEVRCESGATRLWLRRAVWAKERGGFVEETAADFMIEATGVQ